MYEWIAEVVRWLHDFIKEVPIYYAAPAMVLIGALDSSLLSLPEINDYLVVARCYSDPKSVFYFPLFAANVARTSATQNKMNKMPWIIPTTRTACG